MPNDGISKGLVFCRVQFAPNTSHHHPEQKSHHLFENYEYTWETPSQPLSLKYSHITVDKLFCERLHRHCVYGVFVLGLCGFQLCVESSRGPKAHICWTLTLAVLTCADLCWHVLTCGRSQTLLTTALTKRQTRSYRVSECPEQYNNTFKTEAIKGEFQFFKPGHYIYMFWCANDSCLPKSYGIGPVDCITWQPQYSCNVTACGNSNCQSCIL